MTWITTYTGRKFSLASPNPDDVFLADIAHSLSMLCHWNGHCDTFFSVAQHSVLVSRLVPQELALWGLLHDAAEAYYGDMSRPLKQLIPEFKVLEKRGMRAVALALDLDWPEPPELKSFDNLALKLEAVHFMASDEALHDGEGGKLHIEIPDDVDMAPLLPFEAEELFVDCYHTLTLNARRT